MMKEVEFVLPHITLAGWTNNNVGKPVLLALHGWLDNSSSFEPLLPFLTDYHVVAVDLPGHGLSAHRGADAHYHFVEWAFDVAELIRVAQWDKIMIVGHSMGGMIATVVAAVLPQQVKAVVLIEAIGLITTPDETACEQLSKAIISRHRVSQKDKPLHPTFESALEARIGAGDLSDKEARLLLKRGLEAVQGGYVWRTDQRLRTHSAMRFSVGQATSFVTNVKCPVLLIEGEKGFKQISQNRKLFGSSYVDLKVGQIPGGHHCHMEYPALAWQMMATFFK